LHVPVEIYGVFGTYTNSKNETNIGLQSFWFLILIYPDKVSVVQTLLLAQFAMRNTTFGCRSWSSLEPFLMQTHLSAGPSICRPISMLNVQKHHFLLALQSNHSKLIN